MTLGSYCILLGLKFIIGKMETLVSMNWVTVKIKDDAVESGAQEMASP